MVRSLKILIAVMFTAIIVVLVGSTSALRADGAGDAQNRFFDALCIKESSGVANPPKGDGGMARGPYQIWEHYFQDALEADESIRGLHYEDCDDEFKASMVVGAYMRRYELAAWDAQDWQSLARLHNGGPSWRRTASAKDQRRRAKTLAYWRGLKKIMDGLD